ncbi:MAG: hypothetical protein P4N60_00475 [Verrucomicrobiae bacterium]|nr:hypothetical protein [Verrucomicrobiae bacterium]
MTQDTTLPDSRNRDLSTAHQARAPMHFEVARELWRYALRFDLKPAEEKVFAVILFEGVARGHEGLIVSSSHRDLGDLCKFGKGHAAERARVAARALEMHRLLRPAERLDERGALVLRVNFNLALWCAGQHCDVAMHVRQLNVLLAANGAPQWLLPPTRDLNSELPAVCRESFVGSVATNSDAPAFPQIAEVSAVWGARLRENGNDSPRKWERGEDPNRRARERLNVQMSHNENVQTFSVSDAKTNKRTSASEVMDLRQRVRTFVGDDDWAQHWKLGTGWRERLFVDEYSAVFDALEYCVAMIKDGLKIKKTPGAMLWTEVQRRRRPRI